jgi:hypothetical protein
MGDPTAQFLKETASALALLVLSRKVSDATSGSGRLELGNRVCRLDCNFWRERWAHIASAKVNLHPNIRRSRVADDSVIGAPKQITSFLR